MTPKFLGRPRPRRWLPTLCGGFVRFQFSRFLVSGGCLTTKPPQRPRNIGYQIVNTTWTAYPYERNVIPCPIPHFIPTTFGVLTGKGVTLFLAVYSPIGPETSDAIVSDMPTSINLPTYPSADLLTYHSIDLPTYQSTNVIIYQPNYHIINLAMYHVNALAIYQSPRK